ncbi:hypothetical protein [Zestomonas carbonaria]|uniref:hypothetical protein n=1 Tax=Zestomonas carbonaria TaxID=2762745 RepID=UPI001656FDDF|nr:hypothetical protein [Pseudomonas carbonaria]
MLAFTAQPVGKPRRYPSPSVHPAALPAATARMSIPLPFTVDGQTSSLASAGSSGA